MFSRIRSELATFAPSERLFIFFSMIVGFCVACEYGVTRPASTSLFLAYYSAKWFPYVWLATVPLNLLAITLYNRFLPRLGPWKTICCMAIFVISVNLTTGSLIGSFPFLIFFQFAWKDIYILFMFKQLWSMIHSTISAERAKYLYGIIFCMGTLGSVCGSLIPGFFAVAMGSERLFYLTAPIYTCLLLAYRQAYLRSALADKSFHSLSHDHRPREGFALVFRSRYLIAVLLVVVFMQISAGLMEYRFSVGLEEYISAKDLRTEYMGRLSSVMNILSGTLQLVGSFLFVQIFGVRNSHLVVPAVLLLNGLMSIVFPSFAALTVAFVVLKGIDYSLFGVIREMLYIPMRLDEKFRAKAVIDVFAYRSSKALVSLCIIALQMFAGTQLLGLVSNISIAVFVLWISTVWFLLRKHYPQTVAA